MRLCHRSDTADVLTDSVRPHTTVSGSDRLGWNWNVDPPLTFAIDTSGSSVVAVSVSDSSAVQSVLAPVIRTSICGSTAVAIACNGCADSGEHNEIQAASS